MIFYNKTFKIKIKFLSFYQFFAMKIDIAKIHLTKYFRNELHLIWTYRGKNKKDFESNLITIELFDSIVNFWGEISVQRVSSTT